jgi:hypothetical protein
MAAQVDLHLHTTASDGRLSPAELVRLLARRGLSFAAITDHDSTEGLPAAQKEAREYPSLTIIPGVELGTEVPEGEVHILGYFVDPRDPELQEELKRFREGRDLRARRMVQKLNGIGIPIAWERVEELAQGGAIARPHIALALMERGHVASLPEAFAKYIGRDGPAYVPREKMTPEDAIRLLRRYGALPVLAHPARDVLALEKSLPSLKAAGLVGVEVYYKGYTPQEVERLGRLCQRYDLVPCGGSDYHGLGTPDEMEPGTVGPPLESLRRLVALAGAQGRAVAAALS